MLIVIILVVFNCLMASGEYPHLSHGRLGFDSSSGSVLLISEIFQPGIKKVLLSIYLEMHFRIINYHCWSTGTLVWLFSMAKCCDRNDCQVLSSTGPGGGSEDHPGSLPPVWGLLSAARRQVVLPEQLRWQEHDRPELRDVPSLHLDPAAGRPAKVHIYMTVRDLSSKARECNCIIIKTNKLIRSRGSTCLYFLPGRPLDRWAGWERTWMRLPGQWELSITPSAVTSVFTAYRYKTYRYMMADTTEIVLNSQLQNWTETEKNWKKIHYPDSKESWDFLLNILNLIHLVTGTLKTSFLFLQRTNFKFHWEEVTVVTVTVFNAPTFGTSCCSGPDQQHNRGHQQFMGDTCPHGGPAEEWDGTP